MVYDAMLLTVVGLTVTPVTVGAVALLMIYGFDVVVSSRITVPAAYSDVKIRTVYPLDGVVGFVRR
mgnify:CR=1 FL=1